MVPAPETTGHTAGKEMIPKKEQTKSRETTGAKTLGKNRARKWKEQCSQLALGAEVPAVRQFNDRIMDLFEPFYFWVSAADA